MFAASSQHGFPIGRVPLAAILVVFLMSGCSIRKIAINKLGDALAQGGTTFASDDDPELVRDAVPFSLKLIESLLAESPRHRGLLLAAASGSRNMLTRFIQQEADEADDRDIAAGTALRTRARRMYLRARDYGLRGLELDHRASNGRFATTQPGPWPRPSAAMSRFCTGPRIVGLGDDHIQGQAGAGRGAAARRSVDRSSAGPGRELGLGAIHSFLISYEAARQGAEGMRPNALAVTSRER